MKEKLSFVLTKKYSEIDSMIRIMGCFEDIEHNFGIEFAAGVEYINDEKKIIFASDYLFTENEDYFLNKYDGMVEKSYFREKDSKKVYNLNEAGCRLDIMYDDEHRYNGSEQFYNPKIVTKGFAYPKSIGSKKLKM